MRHTIEIPDHPVHADDNGRVVYTAHAHVTGGRAGGHGRTAGRALGTPADQECAAA